ncbi:MAG: DUF4965 domain-containing protein [Planctomycetes bacterium]|nr:DUF4965 domain-containing protein [Planctomycetota bacterium]
MGRGGAAWVFLAFSIVGSAFAQGPFAIRPPSVPLVACDPYFSIWSPHDRFHDGSTTHWTGKPHRLGCVIRIDGAPFRLLGGPDEGLAAAVLPQNDLIVTPTQTTGVFAGAGVSVRMTFATPSLPEDVDILSRPVTYVRWTIASTDGKTHIASIEFTARGEIAVNTPDQFVQAETVDGAEGLAVARVGSVEQAVLHRAGDDLRIDWGYLYLAVPRSDGTEVSANRDASSPIEGPGAVLTARLECGEIGSEAVRPWLMLAYDDLYSIQYMKRDLRPYWRRNGWEAIDLLAASARDYAALMGRCDAFDAELTADLRAAGGDAYARLGALAYRQCFAAGKFVADENGQPLQFCKENHSNGCIGTSDVFYPMAPQFLLFGPTLAKSFLVPFMNYAASDRWKFPFAPHDLGTYPHANGQRYGGGERTEENQMPVEESGNLLLLFAAIARMEGHAGFAEPYWPQLVKWAEYLKEKGLDPENQLCTDDFAGHLAHNVNLSAKAICALGAFAKLCEARGDRDRAAAYGRTARAFAARWVREAEAGDHFRLAFDRPDTWSQKYNLVWDSILELGLFPESVARKEMDFYLKTQNAFGLPLDNRRDYTKLDWVLWTATLTRDRRDFDAILAPVDRFIRETPDRSPLTDWYETKTGRKVGFTGRPVIGGVFLKMLYEPDVWAKYARRDATKAAQWAPMPSPPVAVPVVPCAVQESVRWRFTTSAPEAGWERPDFDASSWREGAGGFGTEGTPGAVVGTEWNGSDIWIRREFELAKDDMSRLSLWVHHDEHADVFLNGVPAARLGGFTVEYTAAPIAGPARAALRRGRNVIAIHCRQTTGGQFIDAGLVETRSPTRPPAND